ncbi:MAG: TIGR00366 family protein [Candidatus Sumerlaeia bacterium]|nr:TIGR00366 family protein [Candidatus Sumerlaeia bacterium]
MSAPTETGNQKAMQTFSTLAILFIFLVVAAFATQLLPQGEFKRVEKTVADTGKAKETFLLEKDTTLEELKHDYAFRWSDSESIPKDKSGKVLSGSIPAGTEIEIVLYKTKQQQVVDGESFEFIKQDHTPTLLERAERVCLMILHAPLSGFKKQAEIIAFILLIGGTFGIITATGAIDSGLNAVVRNLEKTPYEFLIIPAVMIAFSLGGAVFGLSEEVIPFVMITIPLAIRLGYDSFVGLCMSFVAAGLGFAAAFLNPFTVGIAQGISEVPIFSGMQYRIIIWITVTLVGCGYVMWYANKIKANPTLSPVYEHDKYLLKKFSRTDVGVNSPFTVAHQLVLLSLALAIGVISWGVVKKGWYIQELTATFIGLGIISAILGGIGINRAADIFIKGAVGIADAALVIAFSGGIVIILNDGKVLDTLLYYLASSLDGTSGMISVNLMFLFQSILNVVVPSGSGMAALTMPIMAPLSDLLGVSRQTAVLAFQFGDGFGNMIIPTSAVTMTVLSIAEIPWAKWAKWMLPFEALLAALGIFFLCIAVLTGY